MIFIRPKIMRDANAAAYETELKYNYMQDQQQPMFHTSPSDLPPLLPGTPPGKLPPLPPAPPAPPHGTTGAAPAAPAQPPPGGVLTIPPGTALPGMAAPESSATPAPPEGTTPPPQGKP